MNRAQKGPPLTSVTPRPHPVYDVVCSEAIRDEGAGDMNRTGALIVGVLVLAGCMPMPVNPGYVSTSYRKAGKVDLAFHAGGYVMPFAGDALATGGGAFHVEPYLMPKLSLPIGLAGGGGAGAGGASLRAGARYRALPMLAVGGGLGGGGYGDEGSARGSLFLDFELAVGGRWSVIGISLALRPTFDVIRPSWLLPTELAIALYPQPGWAITLHFYGGPYVMLPPDVDAFGWIGGGIGLFFNI
jgi:hypothetical protein